MIAIGIYSLAFLASYFAIGLVALVLLTIYAVTVNDRDMPEEAGTVLVLWPLAVGYLAFSELSRLYRFIKARFAKA